MPRRLKNLRVDEISAVDRGAGKGVRVLLMKRFAPPSTPYTSVDKGDLPDDAVTYLKREFSADERQSAASSGAALPDGSFPIKDKQDLSNAIHAIGRAKDPAAAKAHIKTRASALGATDMLPDGWSKRDGDVAEKALTLAIGSILADGGDTAEIVECFKQFHSFLQESDDMTITVDKNDLTKLIGEMVGKALKDAGIGIVAKMTPDHEAYHSNLDGDEGKKFESMSHDERTKYMTAHPHAEGEGEGEGEESENDDKGEETEKALTKAFGADVAKAIMAKAKKKKPLFGDKEPPAEDKEARKIAKKLGDENTELKKRLAVIEDREQVSVFKRRATEIGLAEADGDLLLKAHRGDPEALKGLEEKIKALHTQVVKGGLFSELGAGGGDGRALTAHDELVAKGAELRKANPKMTVEQAYVAALEQHPEIAKREADERHTRIAKAA